MVDLTPFLCRWRDVVRTARLEAVVARAPSGIPLDTFTTAWFGTVFQAVVPGASVYVGGRLLLASVSVLPSGFVWWE